MTTTAEDDREMFSFEAADQLVTRFIDRGAIMNGSGDYIAIDGETLLIGVAYSGPDCTAAGSYTFQEAAS